MSILAKHTFTAPNTSSGLPNADTGQVTEVISGTWGIDNNRAYYTGTGTAFSCWESSTSDVIVSLNNVGYVNSEPAGAIAFRVSNANNYWLFRLLSNTLHLYKFVNGSASLVASKGIFYENGNHIFKVITEGSSIKCYVNDVLELSTTDTHNQTATKHGIRQHIPTSVRFDDLLIESLMTEPVGTDGTISIELNQSIYIDNSASLGMQQSVFKDLLSALATRQEVHKDGGETVQIVQSIYRDSISTLDTIQRTYAEDSIALPLILNIRDDIVKLIGYIDLYAKRTLSIDLLAIRNLYVELKGGLNVTAENQNFEMYRGDTKHIRFSIEDESLNLAGTTINWAMTPFRKSEAIITKTTTEGISLVDGKIIVKLDANDTESLLGLYEHEVQIVDEYGNVSTVLRGNITIKEDKI